MKLVIPGHEKGGCCSTEKTNLLQPRSLVSEIGMEAVHNIVTFWNGLTKQDIRVSSPFGMRFPFPFPFPFHLPHARRS